MKPETKKELFYWYLKNTQANEILPLEELTIDYILRKKILYPIDK